MGAQVHDLALAEFLDILKWVATKKDKVVSFISRWYPSSKTCSNCGHVLEKLEMETRMWRCPCCHQVNDRDENAAINIKNVGASTFSLGDVSRSSQVAIAA
jgi:putative transposase